MPEQLGVLSDQQMRSETDFQKALAEVGAGGVPVTPEQREMLQQEILHPSAVMELQATAHTVMDHLRERVVNPVDIGHTYWLDLQPHRSRYLLEGASRALLLSKPLKLTGEEGKRLVASLWDDDSLEKKWMLPDVEVYLVVTSQGLKIIALPGFKQAQYSSSSYDYPYELNKVSFASLVEKMVKESIKNTGNLPEDVAKGTPKGELILGGTADYLGEMRILGPESKFFIDLTDPRLEKFLEGDDNLIRKIIRVNEPNLESPIPTSAANSKRQLLLSVVR